MKFKKAVTFSYDDGVESDKKLVALFNKYGLKCSFNISSGLIESPNTWEYHGFTVRKPKPFDKELYAGHEICSHGFRHCKPNGLDGEGLKREFDDDVKNLEDIFGQKIVGMAYAFGIYNDDVVSHLDKLGIKYARTVKTNGSFDLQTDMLRFQPTCHFGEENVFELIEKFLTEDTDKPQIFYLWGHSYELDGEDGAWDRMEEICRRLAGHDDILYGTNTEVFRYFDVI